MIYFYNLNRLQTVRLHMAAPKIILAIALAAWLPSLAFAMTPSQVYESVKDSVVVVKVYDRQGKQTGLASGVMLPSGDIVTNYHVVKAGVRFTVGRGKQATPATLQAGDPDKDLWLLTAPGLVAEPACLGNTARLGGQGCRIISDSKILGGGQKTGRRRSGLRPAYFGGTDESIKDKRITSIVHLSFDAAHILVDFPSLVNQDFPDICLR